MSQDIHEIIRGLGEFGDQNPKVVQALRRAKRLIEEAHGPKSVLGFDERVKLDEFDTQEVSDTRVSPVLYYEVNEPTTRILMSREEEFNRYRGLTERVIDFFLTKYSWVGQENITGFRPFHIHDVVESFHDEIGKDLTHVTPLEYLVIPTSHSPSSFSLMSLSLVNKDQELLKRASPISTDIKKVWNRFYSQVMNNKEVDTVGQLRLKVNEINPQDQFRNVGAIIIDFARKAF